MFRTRCRSVHSPSSLAADTKCGTINNLRALCASVVHQPYRLTASLVINMRPCTAALSAFLNGANYDAVIVDLYTVALASGETLRFSGGNTALTLPAAVFADPHSLNYGANQIFALGPRFGRSKISTKVGVEPAELDIDVFAGGGDLVGTFPFAEAVRVGLFDGATVELDRFFAPPRAAGSAALDTSLGCLTWFYGRVAECDIGRSQVTMKVKSLMNLLAIQQMPRRLYQASCNLVFGDAMCGYNRVTGAAANGTTGGPAQIAVSAAAGSTQGALVLASAIPTAYVEGTIIGATGANAGFSRTLAALSAPGTTIGLFKPWLYPVAVGDSFAILPGCDHTTGAGGCAGRNNLARFGGFPYIPPPEAAF